ncbi:uncharacterized protein LOC130677530 [Microplitis mediator]|uniref:uncharacterized protein LOC130677530 n=1 Tax=Microplitis mediator TaxID=375433 RepID=UPI002553AE86|nr:uncharacterized protein LOC130677530 [Microplitis mediator]
MRGKVVRSTGITVEMVRRAVEELMMKRAGVSARMIGEYLKTRYPIEKNPSLLKKELKDKLDHAVTLGILSRSETDTYCIGTFRQKAYNYKTDLSSFWERYYKKRPGRRLKPPPPKKKVEKKVDNYYSDSSDFSDSDFSD